MTRTGSSLLSEIIDPSRIEEGLRVIEEIARVSRDFESSALGGRGESYRRAQRSPLVRSKGIRGLFTRLTEGLEPPTSSNRYVLLDVLGGDGLMARAIEKLYGKQWSDCIITSDLSVLMTEAAAGQGLESVQQAAQYLVLKDRSVHGVLFAYGTHHIPVSDRLLAFAEAYRVLKPGGRLVVHDFEDRLPVATWFTEVVHRWSYTGHDFPHFSTRQMRDYLSSAGFEGVSVEHLYDPFVIDGESRSGVSNALADHLIDMYGLQKLVDSVGVDEARQQVFDLASGHFRYDYPSLGLNPDFGRQGVEIKKLAAGFQIEMPRVALVGAGRKPAP